MTAARLSPGKHAVLAQRAARVQALLSEPWLHAAGVKLVLAQEGHDLRRAVEIRGSGTSQGRTFEVTRSRYLV